MKAAVMKDVRTVEIADVPVPAPQENEIQVKTLAAGICGGDVRIYKGTFPYLNYPIINGHEFCGKVSAVGANVTKFSVGDYVTAEPIVPCGKCYACSIGKPNCCSSLKVLGVHVNGCFAEYLCVKENRAYKLDDRIAPEDGCLVEPYGIGMHALNRLQAQAGEKLMILGAGPIGAAALDIAKSKGMRVMVSDMLPYRLELAQKLGADRIVNPANDDVKEEAMKFTDGEGFPVILEASGVPAVMSSTQEYIANGGRICLAGVINQPVEFSTMLFCNKEATVLGTRNSVHVFPGLINLFAEKKLHPELLRSHVYELDDYAEAIALATDQSDKACKVVVHISDG